ncbi:MAG: Glycogen debranching enzyme [Candidatus Accumulibacter adjunctus]|uniref:Glycogen debranching enzyme n=1 Tax=Candidatus Accumulibacter adjunctus TaxID=1454001 RepID=A0A011M8N3_9PROT|nr:MAG: Glycogen debranching enzyme [Candidatus Accumulibacter adjunctus]
MSEARVAVWPGKPYPLGATWDGEGVNFALFAEHADKVELCLFDDGGRLERQRIELPEKTDQIWHAYLPGVRPGQLYGYRVHGPYRPEEGHRFNPHKLLLDPYARAIVGAIEWSDAQFGYRIGSPREDLSFSRRDSGPRMFKCQVIDSAFDWQGDRRPNVPWHQSVIYELHVKGFTRLHPLLPPALRGTYAGLGSPPVIEHFRRLGITAVEFLPIQTFVDDRHLLQRGLKNYWGYNSIGYFAPDPRYSASGRVDEFKHLVRTLHAAGIEVIMDVVYNHTAEGNHLGPTLCFRGLDNAAYYRLVPGASRYYMDYTGCGNTLNMMHPRVLQLIMDSLRYWVSEMHVDGFRFDLAAALARELHEVDQLGAFMDIIHQDPLLSQVKLIAEPWDLGDGGYQVGNFPVGWTEWNGKYRDVVRDYWRGEGGLIGQLAYRLTGSSDLYQHSGRRPYASINFITAHDGFTLHDLVSHNEKHNAANGEENRDGESHNRSWNCGAEGETTDPGVLELRQRQRRNLLATLLLSQGVPMLLAGDEMGRTQRGNNNAYCQDNELSWVDWDLAATPDNQELLQFARRLVELRRQHPALRRRHFFQGQRIRGAGVRDIIWLHPDGSEISDQDWHHHHARCLALYLIGEALEEQDERGQWVKDDDFLLLLNGHHEAMHFTLPWTGDCELVLDTAVADCGGLQPFSDPSYRLAGRSLALLTQPRRAGRVAEPILRRRYFMPFGAQVLEGGRVRFRLWAPAAEGVELLLQKPAAGTIARQMESREAGWYELSSDEATVDDRYRYRIDGSCEVPDPASRCNPDGVHGASQVIEPGLFAWTDGNWRGRPWEEAIIYQLHVGAFTAQGSFAAVRERLDHLVELGVTAIQLLPVGAFAGAHGWGHDGVLPFAPAASYGHPDELKELVQTAHHKGLMVLLDLACEHFGPEGNYLSVYAPEFFAPGTAGLAGTSIDGTLAVAGEFLIHNALYWLEEFHLDGLRLNAALLQEGTGESDLLMALADAVREGPGKHRHCHLLLGHDQRAARYLHWPDHSTPRRYAAVWNDAAQQAMQDVLTGAAAGAVGTARPLDQLGACLSRGFADAGVDRLLPTAFVTFLQDHARIGDRALGERLHQLSPARPLGVLTATVLLAPMPPALFMGEEFAAAQPFLYFCDFNPDLVRDIARNRRKSFAHLQGFRTARTRARIPDPTDPATFQRCKLDWNSINRSPHADWLDFHRRLLAVRRREICPRLAGMHEEAVRYGLIAGRGLSIRWTLGDDSVLSLLANYSGVQLDGLQRPAGSVLWAEPREAEQALTQGRLPPWSLLWFLQDAA